MNHALDRGFDEARRRKRQRSDRASPGRDRSAPFAMLLRRDESPPSSPSSSQGAGPHAGLICKENCLQRAQPGKYDDFTQPETYSQGLGVFTQDRSPWTGEALRGNEVNACCRRIPKNGYPAPEVQAVRAPGIDLRFPISARFTLTLVKEATYGQGARCRHRGA
jgi:hypothetical protein